MALSNRAWPVSAEDLYRLYKQIPVQGVRGRLEEFYTFTGKRDPVSYARKCFAMAVP